LAKLIDLTYDLSLFCVREGSTGIGPAIGAPTINVDKVAKSPVAMNPNHSGSISQFSMSEELLDDGVGPGLGTASAYDDMNAELFES